MGHDIKYIPRTAIKSQAPVDFVAEYDPRRHPRVLDDVLRWVCNGARLRGWSGSNLLEWEQALLCDPPPLFSLKQHRGIKGPHQWTAHHHRARRYVALRSW